MLNGFSADMQPNAPPTNRRIDNHQTNQPLDYHKALLPLPREHITTILNKLGAATRTEAVAIALRKHLLKI